MLIQPGETIHASDGRKLRVIAVVATEDEASEYVGMLRVEAAQQLAPGTTGCESSQRVTSASC